MRSLKPVVGRGPRDQSSWQKPRARLPEVLACPAALRFKRARSLLVISQNTLREKGSKIQMVKAYEGSPTVYTRALQQLSEEPKVRFNKIGLLCDRTPL